MTNVSRIFSERPVSEGVNDALNALDQSVVDALVVGKEAGIPQGLVVAIMAAHFHDQTRKMLDIRDGKA